jgi:ATP-dependent Lhr-like helicase
MILSLERGEMTTPEMVELLHGSFPELQIADIQLLVEHLVERQFLDRHEGVARVGAQTERSYARGHYRQLMASFSGSYLLTGRHGAAEIGYIDPTVLSGPQDERLLLLAGRSWRVIDVDWQKQLVWLEPAVGRGKARWVGGSRSVTRDVCQGIRLALLNGVSPAISLSRRALAALEAMSDEIPVSSGTHFAMSRSDDLPIQTWTFAGTRANRHLAHCASIGSQKVRFDALSVQAPVANLTATSQDAIHLTEDELAAFCESIKFSTCVPPQLIARTVVARNFESIPEDHQK